MIIGALVVHSFWAAIEISAALGLVSG